MAVVIVGARLMFGDVNPVLVSIGFVVFLGGELYAGRCEKRKINEELKAGNENECAEKSDECDQADPFPGGGRSVCCGYPRLHYFIIEK
jgi:hypothetical protein